MIEQFYKHIATDFRELKESADYRSMICLLIECNDHCEVTWNQPQ